MADLKFEQFSSSNSVLFLGAHCDDIEIGCGGTLMKLVGSRPDTRFHWVTFSSNKIRAEETHRAAGRLLEGVKHSDIRIESFRNGFFPYVGADIKEYFEQLKKDVDPDLIFTHYRHDLHQDHRVVSELTWNTFRNHTILEYEIPKFDGDLGVPNVFSSLTHEELERKVDILLDCFETQLDKTWFTRETFAALARLRGIECAAPTGLAEAFYCRKALFGF